MSATETDIGVLRGMLAGHKYRRAVARTLREDGPATPSEVRDQTDIPDLPNASKALRTLRDAGGVELLVPEETQKGRLYGLTEAGETAAEVVLDG